MAKPKKAHKAPKPRPDKYAEKVSINASFDEVLQIFSDAAHDDNEEKLEEPEGTQESEEC